MVPKLDSVPLEGVMRDPPPAPLPLPGREPAAPVGAVPAPPPPIIPPIGLTLRISPPLLMGGRVVPGTESPPITPPVREGAAGLAALARPFCSPGAGPIPGIVVRTPESGGCGAVLGLGGGPRLSAAGAGGVERADPGFAPPSTGPVWGRPGVRALFPGDKDGARDLDPADGLLGIGTIGGMIGAAMPPAVCPSDE